MSNNLEYYVRSDAAQTFTPAQRARARRNILEELDVISFGAIGDGDADDTVAIQAALDFNNVSAAQSTVRLPAGFVFGLRGGLYVRANTTIVCEGWIKVLSRGNLDCIFIPENGGNNIEIVSPKLDLNCVPGMSGFNIRNGAHNIRVSGGIIKNARRDRDGVGGGNGFNIESQPTVLPGKSIIVTEIHIFNCSNGFVFQSGDGVSRSNVIVSDITVSDCDTAFWVVGNTAGYPHTPEEMSGLISNVTAYNCGKENLYTNGGGAFVTDRACNVEMTGIKLVNTDTYGSIPSLFHGNGANLTFECSFYGACTNLIDVQPYKPSDSPPTTEYTLERSRFMIKHSGACQDIVYIRSATNNLVFDTLIEAFVENVTSGVPVSVNMRVMSSVFFNVYDGASNGRVWGVATKIGNRPFTDAGGGLHLGQRVSVGTDGRATYNPAFLVNGTGATEFDGGLEIVGYAPALIFSDVSTSAHDFAFQANSNALTLSYNTTNVAGAWTAAYGWNATSFYPSTANTANIGTLANPFASSFVGKLALTDGIAAPTAIAGVAQLYVDIADGDLKIKFGDGVTKVIAIDT